MECLGGVDTLADVGHRLLTDGLGIVEVALGLGENLIRFLDAAHYARLKPKSGDLEDVALGLVFVAAGLGRPNLADDAKAGKLAGIDGYAPLGYSEPRCNIIERERLLGHEKHGINLRWGTVKPNPASSLPNPGDQGSAHRFKFIHIY